MGRAREAPAGIMPAVFKFAPAGNRLALGEIGDRVVAADRQLCLLAPGRHGREQKGGNSKQTPPLPRLPRHDCLSDRAGIAGTISGPANTRSWYHTCAPKR